MTMKVGGAYLCSREKRLFDLSVVIAVGPIMGALALGSIPLLAMENGGVLFRQQRVGNASDCKGGAPPEMIPDMQVLKLMSLPERAGRVATVCGYNHPEAKPFSALVRKLRIDESPQLIAVLRGEMSAVGPRPCTVETAENIMDQLSPREQREWLAARRVAKPGLACMGAEKQYDPAFVPDLREVAYSDIEYVAGASWALDGKIITAIAGGLLPRLCENVSGERIRHKSLTFRGDLCYHETVISITRNINLSLMTEQV